MSAIRSSQDHEQQRYRYRAVTIYLHVCPNFKFSQYLLFLNLRMGEIVETFDNFDKQFCGLEMKHHVDQAGR